MTTLKRIIDSHMTRIRKERVEEIKTDLGKLLVDLNGFADYLETDASQIELRDFRNLIIAYYDSFDWMK